VHPHIKEPQQHLTAKVAVEHSFEDALSHAQLWTPTELAASLVWWKFFDNVFSGKVQSTASGGEVNWLGELPSERAPSVDLAQPDLVGGKQSPEQHGGRLCRWQHGLRLDAPLELFV
jgi:hypothetical protein